MNPNFMSETESILISPAFAADPYPTLAELRVTEPVYWSESIGDWILTRYDDIVASFKDHNHFSNENRLGRVIDYLPQEKRAGKELKKGQVVFQMLNSANRDPAYFPNPDTFDIRREKSKHIAFGSRIHFCVAAVLARTEVSIAIATALRRFTKLELGDKRPDWNLGKRNNRILHSLRVSY